MTNPIPTTPAAAAARELAREIIKDYGDLSVKRWGELLESITAALLSARQAGAEDALARVYARDTWPVAPSASLAVALVCDEELDRSGAMLGRIRDKSIAIRAQAAATKAVSEKGESDE